ncbi:proline-rich protein 36-like [Penaeus japonicus]|uniref:proline-rich protein 36-like n=1 Tax=Penaeus japonicus TaxID=27405 RepID=UPI001C714847|nr:proline-rich protein 36-like [Penaeus japonicus]
MRFFKCLITISAFASCVAEGDGVQQQFPQDFPIDQLAAEQREHSVQQPHEAPAAAQNDSQQLAVETQHWPRRLKPSQQQQRRTQPEQSVLQILSPRDKDTQKTSQHTAQGGGGRHAPSQQSLSVSNKSQPIPFNIALLQSPTSAPPLAVSPLPPPPTVSPSPPLASSPHPSVANSPRRLTFNLRPRGRRVRYRRPYRNETVGGASKPSPRPRYIRPPTHPSAARREKASSEGAEVTPGSESDDEWIPKVGPQGGAGLGPKPIWAPETTEASVFISPSLPIRTPTTLSPRPLGLHKVPSSNLRKVPSRQQAQSPGLPSSAHTNSKEYSDDSESSYKISALSKPNKGVSELTSASANIPKISANIPKVPANSRTYPAADTELPPVPPRTDNGQYSPSYSRVSLQRPPTVGPRRHTRPPTTTPTVPPSAVAPTAAIIPSTKPTSPTTLPNTIVTAPTKTLNRTPAVVYAVVSEEDLVTTTPTPSADVPVLPDPEIRHQDIDLDLPEIYTSYLTSSGQLPHGVASANSSSAPSDSSGDFLQPASPSASSHTKAEPVRTSFVPTNAPPVYKNAPISPARVASLRNLSLFGAGGDASSFAPPAPAAVGSPSLPGLGGAGGLLRLGQAPQTLQQNLGLGGLGYLGLLSGLGGLGLGQPVGAPSAAGASAFSPQQGSGLGLLSSLSNVNLGLGDLGLGSLGTISPLPSLEGLGLSSSLPNTGTSYGGSATGLTGLLGLGNTAGGTNAGLGGFAGGVGALGSLSALGLSPGRLMDAQLSLGAAPSAGALPATPPSLHSALDSAHAPKEGVVAPPPSAVPVGGEEST